MKIKLTSFIALAAALSLNPSNGQIAQAKETMLRLHTFVPPVSSSFKAVKRWAQKVEKDSNGSVKIKLFPSRQLGGKPSELYDQARKGFVDLAWTLPGYTTGRFPRSEVFEMPFVAGVSALAGSQAIMEVYDKWLADDYKDTHPIVVHAAGPMALFSHKPIRTLDDMKGKKIRSSSRAVGQIFKVLGATPVGIPGIKMAEAYQRNVVDSVYTAWSIALPTKIVKMSKFHTYVYMNQPVLLLAMNKKSYGGLSADQKRAFDANSGKTQARVFGADWVKADIPGQKVAKKLGNELTTLSEADRTKWKKMSQPVIDNWVKEVTAKGIDGKGLIAAARAAVAKYAK
jgi:TRAP-type C4-dicarboxylate transport system substrate-binding protein|tara:strand:- start:1652 stop:2677 length:1026 start_codon:yes stop_codon:yes gene_type:complete